MTWTRALPLARLETGHSHPLTLDGEEILLCRVAEDEIYAVADTCSHDGSPLEGGTIDAAQITCPRHGAMFDLKSGKATKMPAVAPIDTYPVRVTGDGWIEVDVEED